MDFGAEYPDAFGAAVRRTSEVAQQRAKEKGWTVSSMSAGVFGKITYVTKAQEVPLAVGEGTKTVPLEKTTETIRLSNGEVVESLIEAL